VWANFLLAFHTSLIKRMVTLLSSGYPVSKGKKTLFIFLLEILDGDGIKAEMFWHAALRRSIAELVKRYELAL
jgi:hypothetical protein